MSPNIPPPTEPTTAPKRNIPIPKNLLFLTIKKNNFKKEINFNFFF
jgi:hypothetical protein